MSYILPVHVENLTLTGTVAINGTGNAAPNTLIGNSANNTLNGGPGGRDVLTGQGGADLFRFSTLPSSFLVESADRLTDFNVSQGDRIQISRSSFGLTAINPSLTSVASGAAQATALASPALLVYNRNTGELLWNQNGSAVGSGSGGVLAVLTTQPSLSASAIQLV